MRNKNSKLNMHSSGQHPNFTVHDEIRRDRRIRRAGQLRKARIGFRRFATALLCIGVCICLVVAVAALVMRTQTVVVSGNARYVSDELLLAADASGEILPLIREKKIYERIAGACPYVESVRLVKRYPSTLEIVVKETEAVFATCVRGQQLSLDRDLRVMDYTQDTEGLIRLELPEVQSAREGSRVVFAVEKDDNYVTEMLALFFDGSTPFLTVLDLRDPYAITGRVEDRAKIIFGDYRSMEIKLALAKEALASAEADQSKRTLVDVSAANSAAVQIDYQGEF